FFQLQNTSTESKPYSGGRQIIRQALLNKKSPEESTEIIIASLEDSTLKQYECTYKLWWKFNQELHSDPFIVSPSKILTFLTKRFQEGASHGTINTAKAALALISQEEISNSKIITRFMKGIYKKRPSKPRYDAIWDVDPVLDKLAELYPLESLSLKELTKKLVLLLALGTAHRIQTLAEIKISSIRYTAHSTRHASTSKAAERGVNVDEIKRVAGWSQKSQVFARFYNLPI
ncbi:GSCOCG00012103001-RA-CDS, partial [Cotesia congregata]